MDDVEEPFPFAAVSLVVNEFGHLWHLETTVSQHAEVSIVVNEFGHLWHLETTESYHERILLSTETTRLLKYGTNAFYTTGNHSCAASTMRDCASHHWLNRMTYFRMIQVSNFRKTWADDHFVSVASSFFDKTHFRCQPARSPERRWRRSRWRAVI